MLSPLVLQALLILRVQELALRDIAALLWDLQDSRTLQLGPHIDSLSDLEAALQKRVSDPSYKFHHLQVPPPPPSPSSGAHLICLQVSG